MEPRLEKLVEKKLVGQRIMTSFSNNLTFKLWNTFMPRRKEIHNCIGTDLYSIQIYDPLFFEDFNPDKEFEKWATIEVSTFEKLPEDMEPITLNGGLYAVFLYRGSASGAARTFEYILGTWLPNSLFSLDDRPHFEILGEKYKNEDPNSEEEIWIPIKPNE
jgi:AraC family transcriptional regulator